MSDFAKKISKKAYGFLSLFGNFRLSFDKEWKIHLFYNQDF